MINSIRPGGRVLKIVIAVFCIISLMLFFQSRAVSRINDNLTQSKIGQRIWSLNPYIDTVSIPISQSASTDTRVTSYLALQFVATDPNRLTNRVMTVRVDAQTSLGTIPIQTIELTEDTAADRLITLSAPYGADVFSWELTRTTANPRHMLQVELLKTITAANDQVVFERTPTQQKSVPISYQAITDAEISDTRTTKSSISVDLAVAEGEEIRGVVVDMQRNTLSNRRYQLVISKGSTILVSTDVTVGDRQRNLLGASSELWETWEIPLYWRSYSAQNITLSLQPATDFSKAGYWNTRASKNIEPIISKIDSNQSLPEGTITLSGPTSANTTYSYQNTDTWAALASFSPVTISDKRAFTNPPIYNTNKKYSLFPINTDTAITIPAGLVSGKTTFTTSISLPRDSFAGYYESAAVLASLDNGATWLPVTSVRKTVGGSITITASMTTTVTNKTKALLALRPMLVDEREKSVLAIENFQMTITTNQD